MLSSGSQRSSEIWADLSLLQQKLSKKVKIEPLSREVRLIGGCDCGIRKDKGIGVITVVELPGLREIEWSYWVGTIALPYRSGYLGFREVPLLVGAYRKLKNRPDLFLIDGQGIAHPRRIGLASHFGVVIDQPTIGCAKSKLIGDYREPPSTRGSYAPLLDGSELLGYVVRTKDNVRCLFASPGHRTDFPDALFWILHLTTGYRVPQPIRFAHHHAKEIQV
ncbi:endonuclease V [candidate division WOR-3 bacterium]|uniref:Endonuclease V n=1 Tax=candidate division WOR-3 bacterium TaxID=2052148 RepID=A0A660SK98_UNCW3|nr:MAG: endonuclease V [candidate division WOR-3 bacterium]